MATSRAAAELGISPSWLSQTIRTLEARLGVRFSNRTTRSVSLADAGERLNARFNPAMLEMDAAIRDIVSSRDAPAGRLRAHMPRVRAFVDFLRRQNRNPDARLDGA